MRRADRGPRTTAPPWETPIALRGRTRWRVAHLADFVSDAHIDPKEGKVRKVIAGVALAGALAISSSAAFAGDYNSLVFHKETQSQDCQVSWVDFDTGNPHWYSTFNPSEANQTWRELNCGAPQVVVAGRNKTLPG